MTGGLIPRPGGTLPPNGGIGAAGTGGAVSGTAMPTGGFAQNSGAGLANSPGNSGLGPLLQLLMGGGGNGAFGQGGQGGLGGLLQALAQMRQPLHSQGWMANRQDPAWMAQHPNAVGTAGTPMPGPGRTGPMDNWAGKTGGGMSAAGAAGSLTAPTGSFIPENWGGKGMATPPPSANMPPVPQNFGPAMNAFLPPSMGGQAQGWSGPGGVNQGASGAPSLSGASTAIPQYSGPPIPDLGPTLQQGQVMANVLGMQNSPNPVLQNMAPLLMQQLLAPQRGPGWR